MGLREDAVTFRDALVDGARADLRNDVAWQIFDAVGHRALVTCALVQRPSEIGCSGTLLLLTDEVAAVVDLRNAPWYNQQATASEMAIDIELLRRSDLRSVAVRNVRRGMSFAGDRPEELNSNSSVEVRYRDHDPMVFDSTSVAYKLDDFVATLRADLAR